MSPHGTGGASVGEEPWPGFDEENPGQIISRLKKGPDDAAMRALVLAYERANQNRDAVIKPLVNWNS